MRRRLDADAAAAPVEPRYCLMINPFYAKDANASFGKHVLTPSSGADQLCGDHVLRTGACSTGTRICWRGRRRAGPCRKSWPSRCISRLRGGHFELAEWYRARGAKVVLGGLHVLSCPEECAPHADALALGDGVQLWPRILRDIEAGRLQARYVATYENDYSRGSRARAGRFCRGMGS